MKTLLLTLTTIGLLSHSYAQESEKVREIGITINRFSFESIPFDFVYKTGKANKYWRWEFGTISGSFHEPINYPQSNNMTIRSQNYGLNMNLGREYRNEVSERFTFYHGPRLGVSGGYSDEIRLNPNHRYFTQSYRVRPSLGYIIGALFPIKENLYFSFDIVPSAYYDIRFLNNQTSDRSNGEIISDDNDTQNTVGFNFTNGIVNAGLFYRIK